MKKSLKVLFNLGTMNRNFGGVIAVMLLMTGCEPGQTKSDAKVVATPSKQPDELAREKLKIALDSWSFGDNFQKFEADHPDIEFMDLKTAFSNTYPKISSYEIKNSRPREFDKKPGFEFMVILHVNSSSGMEIKVDRSYIVYHQPEKENVPLKWDILPLN